MAHPSGREEGVREVELTEQWLNSMIAEGENPRTTEFSYPTWDAWKFQRTMAYWISIMYLEGAVLWIVGAAYTMSSLSERGMLYERALVWVPYLMGNVAFMIGAYAGVIEVINIPNTNRDRKTSYFISSKHELRILIDLVGWKPIFGYISYFIGALCFNVEAIFSLSLTPSAKLLVWTPATLGALGFFAGACLEGHHNRIWEVNDRVLFCLCTSNAVGSFFFFLAGVSGFFVVGSHKWLVGFPYAVGSVLLAVGALCSLWLWKNEQYGLSFLPELNMKRREAADPEENVMDMHAEYGCGRADAWQLPWLVMYIINAASSVVQIGIVTVLNNYGNLVAIASAVFNFLLSHGILVLASVVHHVPTAQPHRCLLIYMRLVMTGVTVISWIQVIGGSAE